MSSTEIVCRKNENTVCMKCVCPGCDDEPVSPLRFQEPWSAMKHCLQEFSKKHPHLAIGKIEVWDIGGVTSWKRKQTRKDWQAQLKDEKT